MDEKRIAILIPCYNEEKTIEKVVRDFRGALPEGIIYVYNNNSTDATEEIVKKLQEGDDHIILRNEYKQGKGNVVRAMFRQIDADAYLLVDGDGTYSADDARKLVDIVLSGRADMVIGNRLSAEDPVENARRSKKLGRRHVRGLINALFKCKINDILSGFRGFSRLFVKGFPILSKGFEIETEMTIHAVDKNFTVVEVPVQYKESPEKPDQNTFSDGAKGLGTLFILFKDYKPFYFFNLLTIIFIGSALAMFLPVLFEFFRSSTVTRIPTLIVAGFLGICGLLSFFVGLILSVVIKKDKQRYEMNLTNLVYRDKNK